MKIPGPDHPITIEPTEALVRVIFAGEVVASSKRALVLEEAGYPPVHYIPRADVEMNLLVSSARSTHCPYKGDASYYAIRAGGKEAPDAVWIYETAHPAVQAIEGYLAFYPDRVDRIEID